MVAGYRRRWQVGQSNMNHNKMKLKVQVCFIVTYFSNSAASLVVLQGQICPEDTGWIRSFTSYLSWAWNAINLWASWHMAGDQLNIICYWWCHASLFANHLCGSSSSAEDTPIAKLIMKIQKYQGELKKLRNIMAGLGHVMTALASLKFPEHVTIQLWYTSTPAPW